MMEEAIMTKKEYWVTKLKARRDYWMGKYRSDAWKAHDKIDFAERIELIDQMIENVKSGKIKDYTLVEDFGKPTTLEK